MNTPSLIGLICGKEGLYFEGINNRGHPFCRKYMKQLVFDEAEASLCSDRKYFRRSF